MDEFRPNEAQDFNEETFDTALAFSVLSNWHSESKVRRKKMLISSVVVNLLAAIFIAVMFGIAIPDMLAKFDLPYFMLWAGSGVLVVFVNASLCYVNFRNYLRLRNGDE